MRLPWTQLSASPRTVLFRWKSFLDHVDHAAPRAPGRWTTARPRKGTTRRQGRLGSCFPRGGEYDCTRVYWFVYHRRRITAGVGLWVSRGMARPAMGVRWGGEACTAAQPPREGGSMQSRRRLFERLEQEEQRLKKHDDRWMEIQQSLLVRQPFFRKASNLWKTAYIPSAIISNNLQPIC